MAIEVDSDYLKGYYRRASANLLLGHWEEAISDLELLSKRLPTEAGLKDKISKAKKEKSKKLFKESIQCDDSSIQ
jgi:serine/threonine-protein phosphatase 5